MKYYTLSVKDFWSGVTLGTFGEFGTMKEARNEALDIDCQLQDSLLFGFEIVELENFPLNRYEMTRQELIDLGEMMKEKHAFNIV
jgi:hypothetical protein